MTTIQLPEVGIVLRAPWWLAINEWGKRVENRNTLIGYRGPMGMITAKQVDPDEVKWTLQGLRNYGLIPDDAPSDKDILCRCIDMAGHLVSIIQVDSAAPNGSRPDDPWAVPGAIGWKLRKPVLLEEPMKASGTQGRFRMAMCVHCGKIGVVAKMADRLGRWLRCSSCGAVSSESQTGRPMLKVKER